MSTIRCFCGDTECPSCGVAQGTFQLPVRPVAARSPRDPATMPAGDINRALNACDRSLLEIKVKLVAAKRQQLSLAERRALSLQWKAAIDRFEALRREVAIRYGRGAPFRLPLERRYGARR